MMQIQYKIKYKISLEWLKTITFSLLFDFVTITPKFTVGGLYVNLCSIIPFEGDMAFKDFLLPSWQSRPTLHAVELHDTSSRRT